MINIDYMIEYITLAENLNFSKSAELLHMTQPVLSRHIATIEEEMGAQLFSRNTRSVTINPAGKIVYDRFKEMIRLYNSAFEEASLFSEAASGKLVISSPYYWTPDFTEPILFEYSKLFPQNKIELLSCQPLEGYNQLQSNVSDLLLTCDFGSLADSWIRRFEFAYEQMGVIVHIDHPLAQKQMISINDLKDCVLILLNPEDSYNNELNQKVERLFSSYKVKRSKTVYSQQVDTIAIDIYKTQGISVVPDALKHMARTYTKMIPLNKEEMIMHACFYYKIGNSNPLISQFLRVSKDVFQNQ